MSSRLPGAGDLYGLAGGGGIPVLRSDLSSSAKRPIPDPHHHHHHQQQQQQLLYNALLLRSVKPKTTHHYLHPSPISPFDLDPNINPNHLLKQQMKSRLEELEKHLLDDSDDPSSATHSSTPSDWSDTTTLSTLITPSPSTSASTSTSSSSSSSSSPSPPSSSKLLLDAATAIADGHTELAVATLSTLHRSQHHHHTSEQRVNSYLTSALASRLRDVDPLPPLSSADHLLSAHLLRDASPCFKFASLAACHCVVESTRNLPAVHLLDFDLGHGCQYLSLINNLSASPPRTHLSITAVADPLNPFSTNTSAAAVVAAAGVRLSKHAERTGVSFRFNVVDLRTTDLTRRALGCDDEDPIVVNFAFYLHRIADESVSPANPRDDLLRRVRALRPKVVTLVEQEMNGNTTPFLARFTEASVYYATLMETLDVARGKEVSGDRAKVEECLARRIANVIAREGAERVERCELFGKWRARMGMAGFRPYPAAGGESLRSKLVGLGPGFHVKEENGGLLFGYSGRTLAVASAWH